jgi:Undecaprenyl-phosphate glucose phosphotransferase
MFSTAPSTRHLNRIPGGAISMSVPRLADFAYANKSSLISPLVLRGMFRVFEGVLVAALGLLIASAYVDEPLVLSNPAYVAAHVATGLATVISLELFGLYSMPALSSALSNMARLLAGWTLAFALLLAALFFLKMGTEFSRVWLATWYWAGCLGLISGRMILSGYLHRLASQGRLYRRAAIYGAGPVTAELISQLEGDMSGDIRICGIFDDRDDERSPKLIAGYPRLGGLTDLVMLGRSTRLDLVIVALPISAEDRLADVMKGLSVLPAEIKLPAHATKLRFTPGTYSHVGSVAMIDLYDKPITDWGTVSKWLFDKIVGVTALVMLAPVMAVIAAAIKLDSRGPVLFRQKRYGFNNELIEVYKFRSMYTDRCDAAAVKLVTRNDDRVTHVGRFIRKSSLDELPQLFNVLIGNLSLVGPRPHAMQAKAGSQLYDDVVDGYFSRHKVKPGITGWAQINGWRGETDTADKIQQRVAHDLYYIENWSVFLDAYILAKTPYSLIAKRENAF